MSQRSGSPFSDRNLPLKRKKIHKNKREQNQKISEIGQSKITHFFKNVQKKQSKNSNPTTKTMRILQTQYEGLKEQQNKLDFQKQQLIQQQIQTKQEFQFWMRKSKFLIQDCVSEIYENVRRKKAQINIEKGFYDSSYRVFTQGIFGQQCQQKIHKLQQQISCLDSQSLQQLQEKQILQQFLQVQKSKLEHYRKQFQAYKQKLRIANQQKSCKFAQNWPLLANRYPVLELLGKGGFSQVYRAYDLQQNRYIAIKTSSTAGLKSEIAHYIVREYENHIKLQHQNIAKLYQVVQVTSNSVCIALEFCDGPQLSSYIKQHGRLSQKMAKYILKQILQALLYLGSLNPKIIHFDLKPQNVMFHKGKIKVLDFGLSRQIDNQHSRIALSNQGIGTYWYLPPQTFKQKNPQISQKVDIWSAGVIFYEMLIGKKPFGHNKSQTSVYNEGIILQANQVIFPEQIQISQNAKSLIRNCLAYYPADRYTPSQALAHDFFK